jgi:hypothetical protein
MRIVALAGAATLLAALGVAGVANAAGDSAPADHAQVTKAAWRGGFWGPRFHGGVFFGPTIGFGLYAPYWAPPAYYAPPPVVVQQGYGAPDPSYAPPVQGYAPPAQGYVPPAQGYVPPAAEAPNPGNWYYCANPQGYYPYVRSCNGQWETVPANPAGGPG